MKRRWHETPQRLPTATAECPACMPRLHRVLINRGRAQRFENEFISSLSPHPLLQQPWKPTRRRRQNLTRSSETALALWLPPAVSSVPSYLVQAEHSGLLPTLAQQLKLLQLFAKVETFLTVCLVHLWRCVGAALLSLVRRLACSHVEGQELHRDASPARVCYLSVRAQSLNRVCEVM